MRWDGLEQQAAHSTSLLRLMELSRFTIQKSKVKTMYHKSQKSMPAQIKTPPDFFMRFLRSSAIMQVIDIFYTGHLKFCNKFLETNETIIVMVDYFLEVTNADTTSYCILSSNSPEGMAVRSPLADHQITE